MEFNSRQLRDAIDRGKFSSSDSEIDDRWAAPAPYRARPAEDRSWAQVQNTAESANDDAVAPAAPDAGKEQRLPLAVVGGVLVAILIGLVGWIAA